MRARREKNSECSSRAAPIAVKASSGMASVGSSHSRLTSAEDNEEASLLGCPPIGLSDGKEFRTVQPSNQEGGRALYPRISLPKTPRLCGPIGKDARRRRCR
jgi:hypothetical protein